MFRRIVILLSITMSLMILHSAEAATTILWNSAEDKVIGIQNLEVSGDYYNVDFVWGLSGDFYGSGFDVSPTTAQQVRNEINNLFNGLSSIPQNVQDDSSGTYQAYYYIPYDQQTTNPFPIFNYEGIINGGSWVPQDGQLTFTFGSTMYARVEAVPIPGAILLFGSSLIGIVGIRRKLK